ncbi:TrbM/KikA/MpfK family conjugal transfer protein (plasmid) [Pseudomonas orientalis]|uniref:TrbM/KikA/MpfK family conjugal transfer protein n=1 Tax=Pseudomonas orientalis TaxID=76758 RepID=UPI0039866FA0
MKMTTSVAAPLCLPYGGCARSHNRTTTRRRVITFFALVFSACAVSPAFAKDPCKTVLCMYGKLTGNSGGSECSSAEAEYFGITVKKRGKINWSKTATARGQFLDSCPAADKGPNKKINDKFGKVMG